MTSRRIIGSLLVALALALAPSGALADKVKDCGTTTESTSPNGNAQGDPFITTTTETQTSACNSNSDTGEVTTSETRNRGGHPK